MNKNWLVANYLQMSIVVSGVAQKTIKDGAFKHVLRLVKSVGSSLSIKSQNDRIQSMMTRKLIMLGLYVGFASVNLNANAFDSLSANVGVTSNYLWRGLEQTAGRSAVSGGIDYSADSGFYAGTWVSNAEWTEDMSYEIDLYAGFSGETNGITYDFNFIQYLYPEVADDLDFSEVYLKVTMGGVTFGYATLADAEGADFGDDSYFFVDTELEMTSEIALGLHIGKTTDEFYAGESYIDYGVNLSKAGFTFGATKTDLTDDDVRFYVSYTIDIDM